MGAISSSGSFSTHSSNQSLLNTRRNKSFLYKGATRRFENTNLKLETVPVSTSRMNKFKSWLSADIAQERKTDILILVISVLLVKVALLVIT